MFNFVNENNTFNYSVLNNGADLLCCFHLWQN